MKAMKSKRKEKFRTSHRKEKAGLYRGYRVIDKKFNTLVDCRVYWPGSVVYCCIWVSELHESEGRTYVNRHFTGSGKAGGHGFHKESAAVGNAIHNAGYDLDESIHGAGDYAIMDSLEAVGRCAAGDSRKLHVIRCYA